MAIIAQKPSGARDLCSDLLHLLRVKADYSSMAELCLKLRTTSSTVIKKLSELEALGYEIERHPLLGVRLLSLPDLLLQDEIKSGLETKTFGREIYAFQSITSTNSFAYHLAEKGCRNGVLVIAEEQTKGKGRMGRTWYSPKGTGLWFSLLLRPYISPDEVNLLTFLSALSVAEAVERSLNLKVEAKWPNDLLIRTRKFCGILSEVNSDDDKINFVIVGIGINVNQMEQDFPVELRSKATSLRIELGRAVHRVRLLQDILKRWEKNYFYALESQKELNTILSRWKAKCRILGKKILVEYGKHKLQGIAEDIDAKGCLLVRTEDGGLKRLFAGDIKVIG